jgi:integrase
MRTSGSPDDFVFESRKSDCGKSRAISRVQAHRVIAQAAEALEFQTRVSCHSLRKTFGYHAWKSGQPRHAGQSNATTK